MKKGKSSSPSLSGTNEAVVPHAEWAHSSCMAAALSILVFLSLWHQAPGLCSSPHGSTRQCSAFSIAGVRRGTVTWHMAKQQLHGISTARALRKKHVSTDLTLRCTGLTRLLRKITAVATVDA